MKLAARILGLGFVLALAACAAAPAAPAARPEARQSKGGAASAAPAARPGEGRVIGTFIREGGPLGAGGAQPRDRLLAGTVQFFAAPHRMVAVHVGRSGRFSVWLPAGGYRVFGRSPSILEQLPSGATRESPCSGPQKITVAAGHTVRIAVTCVVP